MNQENLALKPSGYIDKRIIKEDYRNFDIVARYWKATYRGCIWRNQSRVHEIHGDSIDEVVVNLKKHINNLILEKSKQRGNQIPNVTEIEIALLAIKPLLSQEQLLMISAHAGEPDRRMTLDELSQASQYNWPMLAMINYVDISRRLCDEIGYLPSDVQDPIDYRSLLISHEQDTQGIEYWVLDSKIADFISQW